MIGRQRRHGRDALVLANEQLAVTVLPELGAKVVSLVDRTSGREWLTSEPAGWRDVADHDDLWEQYDKSGWDECVPSVAPGSYPRGAWSGVPLRDHGEVWGRPWTVEVTPDSIVTRIHGLRFPYLFERALSLSGSVLTVSYAMHNLVETPFWYLWSMHPLLVLEPRTRLRLPDGVSMSVEALFTDRPAARSRSEFAWPLVPVGDATRDLSELRHDQPTLGTKVFTERGSAGRAAIQAPDQSWLGVSVDPATTPYLGLWINEGRWPLDGDGLHHVALEPTNANRDGLDAALAAGTGAELAGGSVDRWRVDVAIGQTADSLETFMTTTKDPGDAQ